MILIVNALHLLHTATNLWFGCLTMPEGELSWMDRNTPAKVLQIKMQTFAHKALKKNIVLVAVSGKVTGGGPVSPKLKSYLDKITTKSQNLTELWRSSQIQGDLLFEEGKSCTSDGHRSPALQNRLKTKHGNNRQQCLFSQALSGLESSKWLEWKSWYDLGP